MVHHRIFPHVNGDFLRYPPLSDDSTDSTLWSGLLEARDAGKDHHRLEKGRKGWFRSDLAGIDISEISLTGLLQAIGES